MTEPYENKLTIEELRREVRECWDREAAIIEALQELPEVAPPWVCIFLDRAGRWPDDYNVGKKLQQKLGSQAVPYKTECEQGAGVWYRIRQGMLAPRPETV